MMTLPMAPAERATRLTGREHLSFSSISLYQACPLKWFFKYVAGLSEDTVSASLVFGSAIHTALQRHFEDLLVHGEPPPHDLLMAAYQQEWKTRSEDVITFGKGDTAGTLTDMAARMLRVFQLHELAAPCGSIIAIEEELAGEIIPGCPPLLARLDLATEDANEIVITDFKTARSRWSDDQVADSSTQLLLYQDLARSFAGNKKVRLQFGIFVKTKEPSVEVCHVETDERRITRTRRIVENVWNAIQAEHFYPAPSPMNCPGCPYRGPCRSWDG